MTGTVQAVGSAVAGWAVGDAALAHAQHGDWAVGDARTMLMRHVPAGVSMEQAALARLGAISLVRVREGHVMLGDTVVVLGLGLIGQLAAQLSRLAGARPVIGVDLIPGRLRVAAGSGVQAVHPDEADVAGMVREATDGRMADVVIEATGNPALVPTALDLAAEGGRVVPLGSLRGPVEIDAYATIHRKGIALVGAHERLAVHPPTFRDGWTRERNLDLVLGLFDGGAPSEWRVLAGSGAPSEWCVLAGSGGAARMAAVQTEGAGAPSEWGLRSEGLVSPHIRPEDVAGTYEALIDRPGDFLGVVIDWE